MQLVFFSNFEELELPVGGPLTSCNDNCILILDTEQVYLKLQVTKFKNKEVTANHD